MTKLYYFFGRGRAETTRWMLAAIRLPFENVPIATREALVELRAGGKLPFDQLPLLEIDGLRISQTTALVRYLARRGDLYGDSDVDALWCDMIAGVAADLVEPAITAAFQPSFDLAFKSLQQRVDKFAPRLERRLAENACTFIAANRLTFADIVLGEALTAHLELVPDILDGFPLLRAFQSMVVGLPGVAAYLASPQRWPRADEEYVISVAQVLERTLPPHMVNADRFVRLPQLP